ncbi:unnamed protein product [Microthlaspi erraticum]|uniref:FBD domain-containing protein n=1 Tax=Microthlaspi erraticum TaxID=1685480 RepID=A0A6D2L0U1_9BRAS|nr:unnamed protein product [Microthlaspi erraticum]
MDRISNMSDDLLLKILSSLPTKEVVATMFLSKRWKFIWTMVPKLDFDDGGCDFYFGYGCDFYDENYYKIFRQYVDRFMVLHKSPVLETLYFKLGQWSTSEDLATWIRMAIVRRVRKLIVFSFSKTNPTLPVCLYTLKSLVVLKLSEMVVLDVPTTVCLSSLESLHLECVLFQNKESHRRLLSGCPVLKELVLEKCYHINISTPCFYVVVTSLQRLSIKDEGDTNVKVVINAPSLKYLNIEDTCDDGLLSLWEKMPELVEANVSVVYKSSEKLMGSLTSVKRISLCIPTSVVQSQPSIKFYQLVHLKLCQCEEKWWVLLTWMLESSPKLQVLKLYKCKPHYHWGLVRPVEYPWGQPSSVPECLLFHLHTFEWNHYNGRMQEKEMVAYILNNAKLLKTSNISAWGPQKLKELEYLHRASESCKLVLDR